MREEERGGFTGIFEIVAADKARVGRVKRRPLCEPYLTLGTLAAPIYSRHPYLPKGAKGPENDAQPSCRSTDYRSLTPRVVSALRATRQRRARINSIGSSRSARLQATSSRPTAAMTVAINGGARQLPSGRACGRMIGGVNDVPRGSGHVPVECRSKIGCCMVASAIVELSDRVPRICGLVYFPAHREVV
jgi:hypothetical protein